MSQRTPAHDARHMVAEARRALGMRGPSQLVVALPLAVAVCAWQLWLFGARMRAGAGQFWSWSALLVALSQLCRCPRTGAAIACVLRSVRWVPFWALP